MNRKYFWPLIIALHLLFMGKQLLFENSLLQDSKEYLFAAHNLRESHTLYAWDLDEAYNPGWLTKRPFLYPTILALAGYASCGSGSLFLFITYLLQNLCSLLSISLALKIAKRYRDPLPPVYSVLFLLLSLSQMIYANLIMTEIWLQLCLVVIAYLLLVKPFTQRTILYTSLLLIASMALKPVMMFTAFCFPVYYLLRAFRKLKVVTMLVALLPLLFYFSSCKVNEVRTGYYHYSSISNYNLLHYNTYAMLLNKYGMHAADSMVDSITAGSLRKPSYASQQIFVKQQCTELIKGHFWLYTYLHVRGMALCLLDPGRFDITQFFGLPHTENLIYETNQQNRIGKIIGIFANPPGILLLVLMLFNLYKIYILLRFCFRSRSSNPSLSAHDKLLILFFPVYILFFTGPIGTSRFAMPFIPFVLLAFLLVAGRRKNKAG